MTEVAKVAHLFLEEKVRTDCFHIEYPSIRINYYFLPFMAKSDPNSYFELLTSPVYRCASAHHLMNPKTENRLLPLHEN